MARRQGGKRWTGRSANDGTSRIETMNRLICSAIALVMVSFAATPLLGTNTGPGYRGILRGSSGQLCAVATSPAGIEEFLKANRLGDRTGIAELLASGRIFTVTNGTGILVMGDGGLFKRKVRILEGPRQGITGYVAHEWIK